MFCPDRLDGVPGQTHQNLAIIEDLMPFLGFGDWLLAIPNRRRRKIRPNLDAFALDGVRPHLDKLHNAHQLSSMQQLTPANFMVSPRTSGQTYC